MRSVRPPAARDDADGRGGPMATRPWTVRRSRHVLRDRWISLRADDCVTARGVPVEPYYVLECPDFVHVLALDQQDRVVLVRQYRHGLGAPSLELPGGAMDATDADVVATAARELREETGYTGGRLEHLAALSPDPARNDNRLHLVRAVGVAAGTAQPEASEDLEVVLASRDEVLGWARSGGIVHAAHLGLILLGLSAG